MTTDPTDKAPSIEDDAWLGELVKDLESVTTPCSCRVNGAAYELRVMYAEGMLLRGLLREVADYIDPRVEGYSDLRLRIKEAAHNGRYPDDASSGSPALREDDRDDR